MSLFIDGITFNGSWIMLEPSGTYKAICSWEAGHLLPWEGPNLFKLVQFPSKLEFVLLYQLCAGVPPGTQLDFRNWFPPIVLSANMLRLDKWTWIVIILGTACIAHVESTGLHSHISYKDIKDQIPPNLLRILNLFSLRWSAGCEAPDRAWWSLKVEEKILGDQGVFGERIWFWGGEPRGETHIRFYRFFPDAFPLLSVFFRIVAVLPDLATWRSLWLFDILSNQREIELLQLPGHSDFS